MEHRESPRRGAAEHVSHEAGGNAFSARPFRRFVPPPGVRRLALSRVALAATAGVGVLVLLAALGAMALRTLPRYLHRQPVYELAFRDIVLDPVPPPWYRGGSRVFLERVRAAAHEPERFSVLEVDLERLRRVFRLDPWVQKVVRVERAYPNRVVVHLVYREPVARATLDQGRTFVVDGEAVILPARDIDMDVCGPLITLDKVKPPADPRPGETWKRRSATGDQLEVDELVVSAAALAAFLASVQNEIEPVAGKGLAFGVLAWKTDALWVQYGHRLFKWGEAPGHEAADPLATPVKWEMLRDWLQESPAPRGPLPDYFEYYEIGPTGIRFVKRSRAGG